MGHLNKIQLAVVMIVPADQLKEADRIFRSHAAWMEATHHRDGAKALLSYNLSRRPELSNPMDLNSAPTGNTCFIVTEIYEAEAGVADHLQATGSWKEFPALGQLMEKCKVTLVAGAPIINSLW